MHRSWPRERERIRYAHTWAASIATAGGGKALAPEGLVCCIFSLGRRLRRLFVAGGSISYEIPSEPFAPAPFWRRRGRCRSYHVRNLASGVTPTPKGAFQQDVFTPSAGQEACALVRLGDGFPASCRQTPVARQLPQVKARVTSPHTTRYIRDREG